MTQSITSLSALLDIGGLTVPPLLLCSVIALTIVVERAIYYGIFFRQQSQAQVRNFLNAVQHRDTPSADHIASKSRDCIVQMLAAIHTHQKNLTKTDSESPNQTTIQAIVDRNSTWILTGLNRYLPILDTIITIAPLLGILGTVLGIIESFDLLGSAGMQDPKAVTAGIAQALITTAMGLTIAIFSTIPYHFFLRQSDRIQNQMNTALAELEIAHTIQNPNQNPNHTPN